MSELDLSTLKQTPKQKAAMLKKNAAFNKLSKEKQRIKIAEDVLQMLRLKKITASSTYLDLNRDEWDSDPVDSAIPESCDLSYAIEASGVECKVCGIGSLFVSAVSNRNHLTVKGFNNLMGKEGDGPRGAEVAYLKKWFSREQLDLVEDYFEDNCESYSMWGDKSSDWTAKEQDDRLRLIMRNIISNKGVFNPTKGAGKTAFPQPRTGDED